MARGNHKIPQRRKATFDVVNRFIEAVVLTQTPWPIISDEKYSIVDKALKPAIEVQDRQQALADAPEVNHLGVKCPVVYLLKSIRNPKL